jgi:pyochelin synthetase
MSSAVLIHELERDGFEIWLEEGRLRYRGPQGALTDERLAQLRKHRAELIEELQGRRSAREHEIELVPGAAHEPFPLTDLQSAYLLGRRTIFEYGGVGCHGYLEYRLNDLDVDRLERAWQILIERHPMLRATLLPDGTQQVLESVPPFKIKQRRTAGDIEDEVQRRRQELSHRVYDAAEWPLFDVAVTLGSQRCTLHMSFDLLVADFVSFQRLLRELEVLYQDPRTTLPAIAPTFRDYVIAIRARKDGTDRADGVRADRQWWLQRLPQLPGRPELPLAPSTGISCAPTRFERHEVTLPTEQWRRVQGLAAAHSMTGSTVLLAAFCEVVAKWSRSARFTLALTLMDRQPLHPQIDQVVGDFTSLELLSVEHDPHLSFADRARRYQEQLWTDLDHRSFSGIDVMRELARLKGQNGALFPVVFTSTLGEDTEASPSWLSLARASYAITQTPQVWLDCQVLQQHDGISINWDVRAGVLQSDVVTAMVASFQQLLHDLAREETWWAKDPIPLPESQRARRELANQTSAPISRRLLQDRVIEQCQRQPDRPAVIGCSGMVTFGQIRRRAEAFAASLVQLGVQPRELVAVVLPKDVDQIAAVLGVLLAGGSYLPIDTYQPARRRAAILEDGGVRFAIGQASLAEGSLPSSVVLVDVASIGDAPPAGILPAGCVADTDLAYVIYTGGSTGQPKGVKISHRAAENTVDDVATRLGIEAGDAVLGISNLGFDLSVFDVFGVLGRGATLVLPDADKAADPSHWSSLIRSHRITLWNSVPAQMRMLTDYLSATISCGGNDLPIRAVMMSGDWIPVDLPDRIWSVLPEARLYSLGGATEAAIWSILHPIDEVDRTLPSIPYGRPLRNQSFHVLDKGLRPCPDWVPGDLYIGGIGLAEGYFKDDQKTAASFTQHATLGRIYRTGDVGRYRGDGTIELQGREDLQVKVRGHRIELAEIEAAAVSVSWVGAAVAVVLGERERRELALAVQLADEGVDRATVGDRIAAELAQLVPQYMIPGLVKVVAALPVTSNGKIDRMAVAELLTEAAALRSGAKRNFELPQGDNEAAIAKIFAEVLDLPSVGRHEDFLGLGGNSLLAARAANELLRRMGQEISMAFDELLVALLTQRTVAALSAFVEGGGSAAKANHPLVECVDGGASGGPKLIAVGITARQARELSSLLEGFATRAGTIRMMPADSASLLSMRPEDRLERFVEACFDLVDGQLDEHRVVVIASGSGALAGLELARRLRESGVDVMALMATPSGPDGDDPSTPGGRDDVWDEATRAVVPFPYTGNIVACDDDAATGLDWAEIALGKLERFDCGRSAAEVLRGVLDGQGRA